MMRFIPVLALFALCAGAGAQTLYKCRIGGKLTYSGAPCPGAASTAIEVPAAPEPAPGAAQELKRQQAVSAKLQKERQAREAQDQRSQARAASVAAAHGQRCARLRLQKKWADASAQQAAGFDKEPLRQKARRMGESLAIECPA